MAINNRQHGKNTEREIARLIGGKRVGILGEEDVSTSLFSLEVKSRIRSVAHGFMAQAVRNCSQGKTPMVIIHRKSTPHAEDLVCLRLTDWLDWFGRLDTNPMFEVTEKF